MTIVIEAILFYTDAATFSLRKIPINPPTFALLFTISDPTISKINKTTAPSTSTAEANPPINAHKTPQIPILMYVSF